MSEKPKERINLNELTERELLILVAKNQERLEEQCDKMEEKLQRVSTKVTTLEAKSSLWGAVAGFIAGVGGDWIINKLFK